MAHDENDVKNPGSALGEAVGASMEKALNIYIDSLLDKDTCCLFTKGEYDRKTRKWKKLLLEDANGVDYNIDGVITNKSLHPIILLESKYIRYGKHNRDKGSWICTAHSALRRRYTSVRSSIAILAGNWSGTSIAMINSHDINTFVIPFDTITQLLAKHQIKFDWEEKDRETALQSWATFITLSEEEKSAIGTEMIEVIKPDLSGLISSVLDDAQARTLNKIRVELGTNLGELLTFEFKDPKEVIQFFTDFGLDNVLKPDEAIALFGGKFPAGIEPPPLLAALD